MIVNDGPTCEIIIDGETLTFDAYSKTPVTDTVFFRWGPRSVLSHYEVTVTGLPVLPNTDIVKPRKITMFVDGKEILNTDRAFITEMETTETMPHRHTLKFEYK